MTKTTELNKEMVDLIKHHLPGRSRDTIAWYENFRHDTVLEYNDKGEVEWMISYFFLDFVFDTMIVMQRDNKFPKTMWRILRDTAHSRLKPLRIMSDPTNKVLVKMIEKHGGVWHGDEIWMY